MLFWSDISPEVDPPRENIARSPSPLNRTLASILKRSSVFPTSEEPSGKDIPFVLISPTTLLLPLLHPSPTPRVLQLKAVLAPQPRPRPTPLFIPLPMPRPTPLLKPTTAAPWPWTGSDGPLTPPPPTLNPSLVAFRAPIWTLLGLKTPLVGFRLKRTLEKLNPLPFPVRQTLLPPR